MGHEMTGETSQRQTSEDSLSGHLNEDGDTAKPLEVSGKSLERRGSMCKGPEVRLSCQAR